MPMHQLWSMLRMVANLYWLRCRGVQRMEEGCCHASGELLTLRLPIVNGGILSTQLS
jgi:hypothetical protein